MAVRGPEIAQTVPLPSAMIDALLQERHGRHVVELLVYHRDGVETVELGPGASVVIGRAAPAEVQIGDDSLSREHARFTCGEGSIVVEDLGSLNGTWMHGDRVERGEVHVGEEVVLGRVIVAASERAASDGIVPGLMSHERFRVALEEEVLRARFFGRSVGLVMIRAGRGGQAHVSRWSPRVRALLRPVDKMALYSLDAVAILLPESSLPAAMDLARAITEPAESEVPLFAGVAASPDTAGSAEKLLEASWAAAQAAAPGRPVHSAPCGPWTSGTPGGEEPVTESPAIRQVFAAIARLARSSIPVLLQGETGTGKEVVAHAIHDQGPRSARPMVCVNCGAIPQQLVESTLFGHERGAFTGASQQQKGIFEAADGGTVFLDEIGELSLAAQAALLRVLETKRVTRVGSSKEIEVDVRLIAATHRDLEVMCDAGTFRLDLLYRLNAMTLTIPPLRERPEDIEPLSMRFLMYANQANDRSIRGFDPAALALLRSYSWSGNVRELRNAIERAVVIAEGDTILVKDLPERVRAAARLRPPGLGAVEKGALEKGGAEKETGDRDSVPPASALSEEGGGLRARMARHEAEIIVEALRESQWNQTEAARKLEMPLRTLVHRMKTLGIKKLGYAPSEPPCGAPPGASAGGENGSDD
ncbi:sigma 54-interacting transcriptional regulator [Polyangium aurulentum]|uniref:sigma 54-interacting transcriptional regulator n=1 Tax=Polyangium aurulentum TaxID=2567896 RepID=UPI0010AE1816|nr:sigma 54-interacting transcriptional regulator [Polyangium aurulentum]UQA58458.1 sigma 54-interacting transcriptional regulator [Polyangium aurulentum]